MDQLSRKLLVGLAAALAGAAAPPAFAAQETSAWEGKAELSYVHTSGNTDAQTLAGKLVGSYDATPNRYFARATATYGKSDGEETANKWFLEGRYERAITDRFFAFLTADYLRDKFSGYDYRVNVGPGVGYDFIKTDAHHLKGLAGLLYSYDNFTADPPGSDSYLSGRLAGDYRWKISETLKFRQYADYQVSFDDAKVFFVNSETSLEVKMAENLALGLSYLVAYQNEPPSGNKNTDRTFLTSLVLTF